MSGEGGRATEGAREKILFSFGGRAGRVTAPIFPESSRRRKRGLLRGSIGENRAKRIFPVFPAETVSVC